MTFKVLGLLLALISPLLLMPVEKLLPYPYLIEELVKLLIVLLIIKAVKPSVLWVMLAGFLFAISESVLYLRNIFILGDLAIFPKRLLMAGGLHISTMVLMYLLARSRLEWFGLLIGFGSAVLFHYFFNFWIMSS